MKPEIWTSHYEINSFFLNPQKKLGVYALLNLLQDAAWSHATELGFGFDETSERGAFWVLTRQKLIVDHWPKWSDQIQIKTWLRPPSGPFVLRDFEIIKDGEVIGSSCTSWLMMDAKTRRPLKNAASELPFPSRTTGLLPYEAQKVEIKKEVENLAQFPVRNSDLDMNQHMNNTRYVQWILDSIPFSWHSKFKLQEYEINFLAEAHAGDLVTIQREKSDESTENFSGHVQFRGFREADQKVVFTARLKVGT